MYGNSALQKPQAIKSAAWIKKLRALICSRASASSSLTHEDREKLVLFSLIYLLAGSWAWLLRRWLSSLLLLTEIRAKKKKTTYVSENSRSLPLTSTACICSQWLIQACCEYVCFWLLLGGERYKWTAPNIQAHTVCHCMSYSDKKLRVEDGGAGRKSKKKPKGEDAWRPLGPRDPFAMVCVSARKSERMQLWVC